LSDTQLDATMNGTFGSVRETLMHLFASEEGYTRSVTGNIPTTPQLKELTQLPDFDELRRRAKRTGEDLIRFAEQAEQADLNKILHLDGGTYDAPVIVVVIQAINHAIDHRSQIATLLSQQDIELPALDGWAYNDAMLERS
ncbi:MAG TPA: DinB family protein, partial [Ktedonobacteraceae bacterium]|nr:DinB family protein [Ktedonobacteraceae bacterium]